MTCTVAPVNDLVPGKFRSLINRSERSALGKVSGSYSITFSCCPTSININLHNKTSVALANLQ